MGNPWDVIVPQGSVSMRGPGQALIVVLYSILNPVLVLVSSVLKWIRISLVEEKIAVLGGPIVESKLPQKVPTLGESLEPPS